MAKLKDMWEEIEKGRGFKLPEWHGYFSKEFSNKSSLRVEEILRDDWELEPPPKEELKLFQAIFEITSYENNKYKVIHIIPERLYKNEDDANANKPHFGYICEIKLLGLMPVTFEKKYEHKQE